MRAVQREWTNKTTHGGPGGAAGRRNAVFANSLENLSGRKCQGRAAISSASAQSSLFGLFVACGIGRTRARSSHGVLGCLLFLRGIWNSSLLGELGDSDQICALFGLHFLYKTGRGGRVKRRVSSPASQSSSSSFAPGRSEFHFSRHSFLSLTLPFRRRPRSGGNEITGCAEKTHICLTLVGSAGSNVHFSSSSGTETMRNKMLL